MSERLEDIRAEGVPSSRPAVPRLQYTKVGDAAGIAAGGGAFTRVAADVVLASGVGEGSR